MFERRYIFQTIIVGIYVRFRGCICNWDWFILQLAIQQLRFSVGARPGPSEMHQDDRIIFLHPNVIPIPIDSKHY